MLRCIRTELETDVQLCVARVCRGLLLRVRARCCRTTAIHSAPGPTRLTHAGNRGRLKASLSAALYSFDKPRNHFLDIAIVILELTLRKRFRTTSHSWFRFLGQLLQSGQCRNSPSRTPFVLATTPPHRSCVTWTQCVWGASDRSGSCAITWGCLRGLGLTVFSKSLGVTPCMGHLHCKPRPA